jgi:hypothetical protein
VILLQILPGLADLRPISPPISRYLISEQDELRTNMSNRSRKDSSEASFHNDGSEGNVTSSPARRPAPPLPYTPFVSWHSPAYPQNEADTREEDALADSSEFSDEVSSQQPSIHELNAAELAREIQQAEQREATLRESIAKRQAIIDAQGQLEGGKAKPELFKKDQWETALRLQSRRKKELVELLKKAGESQGV